VAGTHSGGRPRTTSPEGAPCDRRGRHVTRRAGCAAVVVSRPTGGRSLSGGGPAQTGAPEMSPTRPLGGRTADPLWPGEIGSQLGLGFPQVVFSAPLCRLYFF